MKQQDTNGLGSTPRSLGLLALIGALGASAPAQADEGAITLGLGTAGGLPVAGYLGPPGENDHAARYAAMFQLSLDYAFTDLFALELVGGVGALIETAPAPPPGCTTCAPYDGRASLLAQGAIGPKLRLLDSGALSLAVHVGVYRFDGLQFGVDGVVAYDVAVGDSAAIDIGLQYWLLPGGSGDPRQPGESQLDAALLLRLGGAFSWGGGVDRDVDDDGVEGSDDQCPDQPEDRDGRDDGDGCPDNDDDGDGIPAELDADDRNAEDRDGFEDEDGIPDLDDDHDSVPDTEDACPREAGVPGTLRGCPARDGDGDGVTDDLDRCPNELGDLAHDGCAPPRAPTPPPPTATIVEDRIDISGIILFNLGGETIDRQSFALLDEVARVMIEHPEVRRVRIEGHTDETGGAGTNRRLSQRRAESVRDYLVNHGVAATRFIVQGLGSDRPVVPNAATEADRARNRRVEFHIEPNN